MGYSDPWWREDCPARAAGLRHAHWDRCKPDGVHPAGATEVNAGKRHAADQCCECELTEGTRPEPVRAEEPPIAQATETHLYVFTIAGRCARCDRTQDAHPAVIRAPGIKDTDDDCTVDHKSIKVQRLTNDGGEEWTRCPMCNTMIEPPLATGSPVGKDWDQGRGPILDRLRRKLGWIKWMSDRGLPVGKERQ
jgi:hypothetical protein